MPSGREGRFAADVCVACFDVAGHRPSIAVCMKKPMDTMRQTAPTTMVAMPAGVEVPILCLLPFARVAVCSAPRAKQLKSARQFGFAHSQHQENTSSGAFVKVVGGGFCLVWVVSSSAVQDAVCSKHHIVVVRRQRVARHALVHAHGNKRRCPHPHKPLFLAPVLSLCCRVCVCCQQTDCGWVWLCQLLCLLLL